MDRLTVEKFHFLNSINSIPVYQLYPIDPNIDKKYIKKFLVRKKSEIKIFLKQLCTKNNNTVYKILFILETKEEITSFGLNFNYRIISESATSDIFMEAVVNTIYSSELSTEQTAVFKVYNRWYSYKREKKC